MNERRRIFLLVLIMVVACAAAAGTTIVLLYRADFEENKRRLMETAQSQARLIEAVARFDAVQSTDYPGGALAATLSQIVEAHERYEGHGETTEFTLARREGDLIVFLFTHRHTEVQPRPPISFDSDLAEPMRRALKDESGTVVGLDYRGETVLAAHEPVHDPKANLDLGIVAKIDMAEIRAPFIKAGLTAAGITLLIVVAGTALFIWISDPMVKRLRAYAGDLERDVEHRTRELVRANEAIRLQSRSIRELSTPVIRLWEDVLLLPLVGVIDTPRSRQIIENLLEAVVATESQVAILDVTGVPVIDTKVAETLVKTVTAAKMLGAEVILTGFSPEAAQTLVQLNIDLAKLRTRGTLRTGLAEAFRLAGLEVTNRNAE